MSKSFKFYGDVGIRQDDDGNWIILEIKTVSSYLSLDELIERLVDFRDTHTTPSYDMSVESEYGDYYASLNLRGTRKAVSPDDDNLVRSVLEGIRQAERVQAEHDRAQFERLRAKFGDDK